MQAIHHYYDQLTDTERDALDSAFSLLTNSLKVDRIPFHGGDPIEAGVEGVAYAIISARPKAENPLAYLTERNTLENAPFPRKFAPRVIVKGEIGDPDMDFELPFMDPRRCDDCPHAIHSGNCAHCEPGSMCNPHALGSTEQGWRKLA